MVQFVFNQDKTRQGACHHHTAHTQLLSEPVPHHPSSLSVNSEFGGTPLLRSVFSSLFLNSHPPPLLLSLPLSFTP